MCLYIKNKYFLSAGNLENLSFVLKISEKLNLNIRTPDKLEEEKEYENF